VFAGASYNSSPQFNYIKRLRSNGTLDPSFQHRTFPATGGSFFDGISWLVAEPDDQLVAVGYDSFRRTTMRRLNSNGSDDLSFGTQGLFTNAFGRPESYFNHLQRQSDGKYLITGFATSLSGAPWAEVLIVRLHDNGTMDSSFSTDGIVIEDWGGPWDYGTSVALTPERQLLVGGTITALSRSFPGANLMQSLVDTNWG
jgi:uncharacterized delta-60 repeat protein